MQKKTVPSRHALTRVLCLLPESVVDVVDDMADRRLTSRSEIVRHIVTTSLQAKGLVASPDDAEAVANG